MRATEWLSGLLAARVEVRGGITRVGQRVECGQKSGVQLNVGIVCDCLASVV